MDQKILAIITGVVLLVGGVYFFVYNPNLPVENGGENPTPSEAVTSLMRVAQPTLGLSFAYQDGESGYVLSEIDSEMETDPSFAGGYALIRSADATTQGERTEGPPSISIRVFTNDKKNFPRDWANTHALVSNIGLMIGKEADTVVGGANGIRYFTDGLYKTDNVIVAHGSYMYVISGSFIDEKDAIRTDYEELLKALQFIPEV